MKQLLILFLLLAMCAVNGIVHAQNEDISIRPQLQEFIKTAHTHFRHREVCPATSKDSARCFARVLVEDNTAVPLAATVPAGYGPTQFLTAYGLGNGRVSKNTTIAIVDAYGAPNIIADLNTYSATFGISQMKSCAISSGTASSPCFQKVDQTGGTKYPSTDSGWALETSLDVEVAHAVCQTCNILLVEAKTANFTNLMAAVDQAVAMHADVVSNSYGGGETATEGSGDSHFNHPGIAFTVSSGDNGYGVSYPAASQYVTAVGGTTLDLNADNTYQNEDAWNGAGSGCSSYEPKLAIQSDTKCKKRTVADVSADADPNTGAAVYDTTIFNGKKGWMKIGGTSLAGPLIAAVYALAHDIPATKYANTLPYIAASSHLHDVVGGSNGSCGGTYLCSAKSGYDGPTGLGSPKGLGGF